jgi:hypothetical protein
MRKRLFIIVLVALALTGAASAHHSISSAYDSRRSVSLEGSVVEFRFVNPHPYVMATATADDGQSVTWRLEMDNRRELESIGMSVQTLRPGDRILVTGSPSWTEPRSLYVRKLVRSSDGFEYQQVGASPRIRSR